jgi:flagellar biosynthetic protein FlhB
MAEESGDRTEEATQTRREEFRKRGQVAQTRELTSAFFLIACAGLIYGLSKFFFKELSDLFQYNYGGELVHLVRTGDNFTALRFAGTKLFVLLGPVFAISLIVSIGASVLQTGFLQVEDALSPNFDKINPVEGFKRLFSLRSFAEGFKAFLKMVLIATVVYFLLRNEVGRMPRLMELGIDELARYIGVVVVKLFGGIGIALIGLAGADYFFQRWDLEKRMMMTKQEVKDEMKNRELDPMIKSRIRRVQREMANKRMMQKVPQADVIITNPTHIAVALKYGENLPAPQLIAKGADLIAEKIKEIAKEHNIPIVENKPLARTIYKTMKLGQVIPRELYVAVAEVLSYVYRLKRKFKGRR